MAWAWAHAHGPPYPGFHLWNLDNRALERPSANGVLRENATELPGALSFQRCPHGPDVDDSMHSMQRLCHLCKQRD